MTVFESALEHVFGVEGGYVNDPKDSGGETNMGITERVARKYGYTGPMARLPRDLAADIYRREYWEPLSLDAVSVFSERIATKLFDAGVNVGPRRAAEWFQRALNVLNDGGSHYDDIKVDGDVGPKTIAAFQAYSRKRKAPGEKVMLRTLNVLQGEFYIRLAERRPKDERFAYGWILQRIS